MFYVEHGYPNELYHFGIKGMKWGVRRYQNKDGSLTTAGARRYDSAKSAYKNAKSEHRRAKKAYKEKKPKLTKEEKRKRAIKVGVAVVGTALAAYGTYKLAKYVQNERVAKATAKAEEYINGNFFAKYGETEFKNGARETYYRNGRGREVTIGSRGSKEIGKYNAKVVARGRRMRDEILDTRLDKGLSKVVNAGDAVGKTARNAGDAVGKTARNAGDAVGKTARKAGDAVGKTARKAANRVLDKIDPIYEYTPDKTQTTKTKRDGMNITKTTTTYRKRKVRRG